IVLPLPASVLLAIDLDRADVWSRLLHSRFWNDGLVHPLGDNSNVSVHIDLGGLGFNLEPPGSALHPLDIAALGIGKDAGAPNVREALGHDVIERLRVLGDRGLEALVLNLQHLVFDLGILRSWRVAEEQY